MMNHPWDADASVFQYPPLDGGSGNPILVLQATFATVFNGLPISTNWIVSMWRLRIETEDGETLYNAADIEQMIAIRDDR